MKTHNAARRQGPKCTNDGNSKKYIQVGGKIAHSTPTYQRVYVETDTINWRRSNRAHFLGFWAPAGAPTMISLSTPMAYEV